MACDVFSTGGPLGTRCERANVSGIREPHHTLRHRMRVVREAYCWTCHSNMDPLGLPTAAACEHC
ncbi:MAG: DUF1588 domain-containing protein [Planctomycetota bacterium]|nr:DUF1588 domain-containing protein [Planctomycetota bacterium]